MDTEGTKKERKRFYHSFPFEFDEFYHYCEEYYAQYGDLNVPVRCAVLRGKDGLRFVPRATSEENSQKIYDLGPKLDAVRRAFEEETEENADKKRIELSAEQCAALDKLTPEWRTKQNVGFAKLYKYATLYKEAFGHLNVPLKCVVTEKNGKIEFKNFYTLPLTEHKNIVYYFGIKLADVIKLSNGEPASTKTIMFDKEHFDKLAALDPYWNYPKNSTGDRIDPITGKNVDATHAEHNEMKKPLSSGRRINVFDFDQFYSYALLYFAKYNNLSIHKKTVAVKVDGKVNFARHELAVEKKWPIVYHLGRVFAEIRYTRMNVLAGTDKYVRQTRYLDDGQYQKLEELDPNWVIERPCTEDVLYKEWYKYKNRNSTTPKKQEPKPRVPKRQYTIRTPVRVKATVDTVASEEKKVKEERIPREVIYFDFDTFYQQCEHQYKITQEISFSKAKVVTITRDGMAIDYPIGRVWQYAADTKKYEINKDIDRSIQRPDYVLSLSPEQTDKLTSLDPLWYLSAREKRQLHLTQRNRVYPKLKERKITYGDE